MTLNPEKVADLIMDDLGRCEGCLGCWKDFLSIDDPRRIEMREAAMAKKNKRDPNGFADGTILQCARCDHYLCPFAPIPKRA